MASEYSGSWSQMNLQSGARENEMNDCVQLSFFSLFLVWDPITWDHASPRKSVSRNGPSLPSAAVIELDEQCKRTSPGGDDAGKPEVQPVATQTQNKGCELDHSNIHLLYEPLKHEKGLGPDQLITITEDNSTISTRSHRDGSERGSSKS